MIAMIVVLIVLMVCGMPIGFSLLLGSLAYFLSADASLNIIVQKMAMTVGDSFSMMAVPFFMFAGAVMNHSGITGQIFGFADKLVGHIRGGMGHANILASVIFAGMSGSAIADTGGLGAIELKAMKDAGYDDVFSCYHRGVQLYRTGNSSKRTVCYVRSDCRGIHRGTFYGRGGPGPVYGIGNGYCCLVSGKETGI